MDSMQQRLVDEIPALRRYARVLTQDQDAADDLVQDCLERAWSRINLWRPGSNLRSWLFTIMHNLYVNLVRKHQRNPQLLGLNGEDPPAQTHSNPENQIRLDELENAVSRLPVSQREALTLTAVEGVSYKDVARIQGVPIGTVMSRLHRGRETLRSQLFNETPAGLRRVK